MKNIWLSKADIAALPTSGAAWDVVKKYADQATGAADLSNQDSQANVQCLAAALVYARTGDVSAKGRVIGALDKIIGFAADTYKLDRALALGRELCAYVIAADICDLSALSPTMDTEFQDAIRVLLTKPTTGGPSNLIACQKQRPNNWGMHATASIVAVYAYLGDTDGLNQTANVFKGWLGDYAAYHNFKFTAPLDWHADPAHPVGINPKGAQIQGHNVDGVLPDDLRRGGGFAWPPPGGDGRMYSWEALQGATVAAQLLSRAGYDAWNWSDKALLRAATWLYDVAKWPPSGDDGWQPWLINAAYGSNFPAIANASPGKNMGFTAWTHAAPVIVKPPVPDPTPDPTPTPDCADCLAELAAVKAVLTTTQTELATVAGKLKAITDLVLSQQGD